MNIKLEFTEERRDELAKNIITDAVIMERTAIALNQVQKVVGPGGSHWEGENNLSSILNAYHLFDIPEAEDFEHEQKVLPVTDVLWKIFFTAVKDDLTKEESRQTKAYDLAQTILEEWKAFLNAIKYGLKKVG